VAHDASGEFHAAYWRSLRNAPPIGEWTAMAIGFLSDHQQMPPEGDSNRLALLLELLRERPILLVLDNFETLLETKQGEAGYRIGFAGYGALLQMIAEANHESCLLVTSREVPPNWSVLSSGMVRAFELAGLTAQDGQLLLSQHGLSGNPEDYVNLIDRYAGNGLA
jgi:hypothetical protein